MACWLGAASARAWRRDPALALRGYVDAPEQLDGRVARAAWAVARGQGGRGAGRARRSVRGWGAHHPYRPYSASRRRRRLRTLAEGEAAPPKSRGCAARAASRRDRKSTRELQSQSNLVCRLLLEKK